VAEPTDSRPQASSGGSPQGKIDGPPAGAVAPRLVLCWGWAIDAASQHGPGISSVQVGLDGVPRGTATYGLPRYDVADVYGAACLASGWQFALDLDDVPPGQHRLAVTARSAVSGQATTYEQTIMVAPAAAAPVWRRDVLFISGCPGASQRYRCEHAAEQVRLMGRTADVAEHGQVDLAAALERYRLFILHRVQDGEDVAWFVAQARQRGRAVLYDVDDLVFDVAAVPSIAQVEQLSEREQAQFRDCVERMGRALDRCDGALVTTEPLRERVDGRLGSGCAHVAPNVVSQSMLRQAQAALVDHGACPAADDGAVPVRVGYFSGTPTHDRDLHAAVDGLLWALETFPTLHFVTVGPVAVDDRFARFGERVEQWPLHEWSHLPAALAAVDVNIAPLEGASSFTDAKSSIKFLEAALVGVPTIASPRADFRRVIQPGVTGCLADSAVDWRDALGHLVASADVRQSMGQAARVDVLKHHTTAAQASALWAHLGQLG